MIEDMLKGMLPGNLQDMLQKAQSLQQDLANAKAELSKKEIEASSGGGVVTVRANGKGEILSLKINPSVVVASDVEMLEDLVRAAINEALRQSREALKAEMTKATGGLPIPGLTD